MPKNTKKTNELRGSLTILVRPYQGRYIAICKETGVIREAHTFEEARRAIFSATLTLLKAVEKDKRLLPSLDLGLSFGMKVFYYRSVLTFLVLRMKEAVEDTLFFQGSASQFAGMIPAHG